jgi:hypothetical protein
MESAARYEASAPRRFDAPNFLWHFGAIVGIFATGFLAGEGWERYGKTTLVVLSCAFVLAYTAGAVLLVRRGWRVPGGVLATLAVTSIPLLVYSIQKAAGIWPESAPDSFGAFHQEIHGSWIAMELATIAVGLAAVALARFPLVLAPVSFVAWYFSMDLAPAYFGEDVSDDQRAWVSIGTGAALVGIGLALDLRGLRRFAFWPHVFGFLALLGAICWLTIEDASTGAWIVITLVSLITIFAAIPLGRSTFAVFGGIGLLSTLCYWSHKAFWDTAVFPIALAAIGLGFVGLGMLWQVRAERWGALVRARLARARG